ncbi:MAG: hypothetical protein IAF08_14545, partial [Rhizobacter sp.]|nr:hypothetical protein [Chlorobiales bacterium]
MAQAPPKSKKQSKPAVSTATSAAKKNLSRKLADEPSIFPETYQDALALALLAL